MIKFNAETKIWESQKFPYPFSMDTFMGEKLLESLEKTPKRVVQVFHEENYELTCDELLRT